MKDLMRAAVVADRNTFGNHAGDRNRRARRRQNQKEGIDRIDRTVIGNAVRADPVGQRNAEEHAHHLYKDACDAQNRGTLQKFIL